MLHLWSMSTLVHSVPCTRTLYPLWLYFHHFDPVYIIDCTVNEIIIQKKKKKYSWCRWSSTNSELYDPAHSMRERVNLYKRWLIKWKKFLFVFFSLFSSFSVLPFYVFIHLIAEAIEETKFILIFNPLTCALLLTSMYQSI